MMYRIRAQGYDNVNSEVMYASHVQGLVEAQPLYKLEQRIRIILD